jgi:hypothetical protein
MLEHGAVHQTWSLKFKTAALILISSSKIITHINQTDIINVNLPCLGVSFRFNFV